MAPLAQIAAMAMAPDASWAVTVSADGTVRTWGGGVPPRVIRRAVTVDRGQPVAVALSGDRVRVLWATGVTIRLYENVKGAWPRNDEFTAPEPVRALALSPSGLLAVVACDDGTVRTLNAGTGEFGLPLVTGRPAARAVAVASDQGPVVAAFPDGDVRRYDLAAGTSETMDRDLTIDLGIDLVAVSPDGETVIAACSRGYFSSRFGLRDLDSAITAIAVGGTGKVLTSWVYGTLWLYDLTTLRPPVEFAAPVPSSPLAPSAPAPPGRERYRYEENAVPRFAPPEEATGLATTPPDAWAPVGPRLVDKDVRFTVYRPQTLFPGVWASLLVFAHKTELIEEPGQPPLDPNQQVEDIARAYFGSKPAGPVGVDARGGVSRGARLRITVDLPRIQCNPAEAEFDWREPVHHVVFRVAAPADLVGSVVRGAVRVWCGPLILGEVSLAIGVTATAGPTPAVAESAARYRRIFPSYSHDDRAIVDWFAEVVRAFGDEYLRDVVAIRSGERWRERLPQLIEQADIFQLFWSSNSMRSPYCREEWEYALALGRPLFVRPFYWEDPRPEDRAAGLPPVALDALEFAKVSLFRAREEPPTAFGAVPEATAAVRPPSADYLPQAQPGYPPQAYGQPEYSPPGPAGYPAPGPAGYPPMSGQAARPGPSAKPAATVARRRAAVVAALVVVVIVVAVIIGVLTAR